jgi:hypothetical protein
MICRNVVMLSRAAERDRSDPRVGTDSVMRMSQHKMVTFVNGNVPYFAALGNEVVVRIDHNEAGDASAVVHLVNSALERR